VTLNSPPEHALGGLVELNGGGPRLGEGVGFGFDLEGHVDAVGGGGGYIHGLGVGEAGVFEGGEGVQVSFFDAEVFVVGSLGPSSALLHEAVVPFHKLPHQRIRDVYHDSIITLGGRTEKLTVCHFKHRTGRNLR